MVDIPQVLGIDVGGTAIKLGRFSAEGDCLQSFSVETPQPATPEAVVPAIVAAIKEVDRDRVAIATGMGTPGPANAAGRVARIAFNLPGWVEVPIADQIEALDGRPVTIANDANCAGLGEAWLGAGSDYQDFILLTLGTGVGGAIIQNGDLFLGRGGAAGELGVVTLNPDGPPCNSGNQGSLEQYVSATAIRRRTGMEPHELAKRAREGEGDAISFWHQYGRDLGAGLTSLIYVLTPEAIVIGGGVSASADLFLPTTEREIERRVQPASREGLVLKKAELGNRAGMVGAARLAWQRLGGQRLGDSIS
ncbi:Glucokinase [Acaryochloris thomasi RCC1774]|uniref:Glucokinase n=1 Tax=Acaryochloris thomasi RCC1774 TaxID=1764569 RepID=A0A2W1JLK1_9CYAN|nr:ROK family protein [Acaryochloris thomasi]PZD74233.1 Glucokinase [Acaryochloris thomasi RCC1774]